MSLARALGCILGVVANPVNFQSGLFKLFLQVRAVRVAPDKLHRFSQLEATMAAGNASVSFRQEPNGTISGMAEPRPRRGHGEDSIYFDQANNHWVGAVSLRYKAGKRSARP